MTGVLAVEDHATSHMVMKVCHLRCRSYAVRDVAQTPAVRPDWQQRSSRTEVWSCAPGFRRQRYQDTQHEDAG